jgi:predicted MFS family arabinose efflux permease
MTSGSVTIENTITNDSITEEKPAWAAVFSLGMGVAGLVMAELLPVSLLTPMAKELGITEGLAGQSISATAIIGLFSSLFSAAATRHIDRRKVVLSFSVLLVLSNLMVAFAPNYLILLSGRLLLGLALGGFWAMAAAIAMRLVPQSLVPRAFSIIFGAVAVATALAAPLGSYLGGILGWRGTFMVASGVGVIAFVWQYKAMPAVPPSGLTRLRTLVDVLKRPKMGIGMLAVLLVFAGHFAFFTYLRPFLETVTGMEVNGISAILLAFGVASFIGTSLAGPILGKNLIAVLAIAPLFMGLLAGGLIVMGASAWVATTFVALWGFAFGTVPVAWSTWNSGMVPDEAESAGALLVAVIQLAVTIGAASGGVLFDMSGAKAAFTGSSIILLVAALLIFTGLRSKSSHSKT